MYLNVVIWVHSVVYVHYTKSESRATGSFLPQICLRRWDFLRNNIRNIWSRQPKQRGEGNMGNTPLLTRKNTLDDTRKLPRQKWNWWVSNLKGWLFWNKVPKFHPRYFQHFLLWWLKWNHCCKWWEKTCYFCPMIDLVQSCRSTNKKHNYFYWKKIIPSNNDWHIEKLLRVTVFQWFFNNQQCWRKQLATEKIWSFFPGPKKMESLWSPEKKSAKNLKDQSIDR